MLRDACVSAEGNRAVGLHRLVVQEVLSDHVSLVAETKDELAMPVAREALHDVPKERPVTDLHHRFRSVFGFLPKTRSLTAAQYHDLHTLSLLGK